MLAPFLIKILRINSVSSDLGVAFEFLLPFNFMNMYPVSNRKGIGF